MFARVECPKCGCCNHVPPDLTPGAQLCCRDCGYRIVPGAGRPTDGTGVGEEPKALPSGQVAPLPEAATELPMPSQADELQPFRTGADAIRSSGAEHPVVPKTLTP
jgi:hypothetical protein